MAFVSCSPYSKTPVTGLENKWNTALAVPPLLAIVQLGLPARASVQLGLPARAIVQLGLPARAIMKQQSISYILFKSVLHQKAVPAFGGLN
jgi:hypothetical protein